MFRADLCSSVKCNAKTCYSSGKCNSKTGFCEYKQLSNGASCNDGNGGTYADACAVQSGKLPSCKGLPVVKGMCSGNKPDSSKDVKCPSTAVPYGDFNKRSGNRLSDCCHDRSESLPRRG